MTSCQGCTAPIPLNTVGRRRKWCSDRCRRDTLYGGTCVVCGARTNGNDGPGTASDLCGACSRIVQSENALWTSANCIAAIRRWADGHGGVPPTASDWNTTTARLRGKPVRGDEFPTTNTVRTRFGTWNAAIEAAGFSVFAPSHYGREGEDPEIIAETIRLYRAGLSTIRVGEIMGVTGAAVTSRLHAAGEPTRTQLEAQRLRRKRERAAA